MQQLAGRNIQAPPPQARARLVREVGISGRVLLGGHGARGQALESADGDVWSAPDLLAAQTMQAELPHAAAAATQRAHGSGGRGPVLNAGLRTEAVRLAVPGSQHGTLRTRVTSAAPATSSKPD